MSLPSPSTARGGFSSPSEQEMKEWDAPLAALAQKSRGDLRLLMYAFFSFLHRRTDFYIIRADEATSSDSSSRSIGFKEGEAEQLLLAAFRQFPLVKIPATKAPPPPQAALDKTTPSSSTTSLRSAPIVVQSTTDVRKKSSDEENINASLSHVRLTEEGKQIPVGNGGCTTRYQWTQTIDETSVVAKLPEGTKGKDLQVAIRPTFLSVRLKDATSTGIANSTIILEGDLHEWIRPEESTWTIEGCALLLTLDKVKKTWWATVLAGDDEIDTQLVDSTRKIGEYDESTQGALRKIMFDQSQQRLGLPTSDQILGDHPPPLPPGVEYIDSKTLDEYKGARVKQPADSET